MRTSDPEGLPLDPGRARAWLGRAAHLKVAVSTLQAHTLFLGAHRGQDPCGRGHRGWDVDMVVLCHTSLFLLSHKCTVAIKMS